MRERTHGLTRGARLALFIVSYIPLFMILTFQQLYKYSEHLIWGGFNTESILHFIKYFGAVSFIGLATLFGVIGLFLLLKNVERRSKSSGDIVSIIDIENKNSESISYLFTYLIPFVFQDLSELINVVSVSILLLVTYVIYTNSSMLLINPTISIWYSLYEIEYIEDSTKKQKKGMILSKDKYLEEYDKIKLKRLSHRLYYSTDIGDKH